VKKIAQMHSLRATFMPKPLEGHPGSGMHVHQSLFDAKSKTNLFYDIDDQFRLSKLAYSFIAGQMQHIKAICAITNPTINSYKRLTTGFEAPVYITWSSKNRSALIRIPNWFTAKCESARIELRNPDLSSNPYLAFAVMLKAGMHGIQQGAVPANPVDDNIFTWNDDELRSNHINYIPTSLVEALEELKKDELISNVLGPHLFGKYIDIKTREVNEYKQSVTPWELKKYIDLF
jgi:glutamine synthetase